jgi:heat shock protein HtpX
MASNLYTHQSQNITKTWLLMTVFFVLVILLGYFFAQYYGDPSILYVFVAFSIFMNIFSYWFSHKIVLSLAGARPANRQEHFDLYTTVENLAITAGLPMPKVYIVNDPAPNAFATGRDKKHAVVCVTTGLLQILEKNELEGVIGHELSHIGNRDMLVSTIAVVLVGFVTILADVFTRSMFFGGHRDNDNKGGNILMLVGIVFAILSPIFAMLIQLAISRKREFLADASGALLTRYPEGLASALKKISQYSRPMARQSKAIAHLYIADPRPTERSQSFGRAKGSNGFANLFATHPPVEQRVKALTGR